MVVEPAVVQPSRSSFNLRIDDDGYIEELSKFVDSLRNLNPYVKIGLQLIHFLKIARSGWRQKVEDLKQAEIEAIPGLFAAGAKRAKKANFDFVELHMAHFTTLASFLSLTNKRKDKFGGDYEGRLRLSKWVILSVRDAVGKDFPLGVRINGEEFTKEGNTLLQTTRIALSLARAGVDYISVSAGERFEDAETPPPNTPPFAGTGYSGSRMSPSRWHPDGANVFLASKIRKFIRDAGYEIPVVTAGKIRTPDLAEKNLEEGSADIIGLGRALLCDPDWPKKALEERAGSIVKCAACGYCSDADRSYRSVTCIQWPKGALNAPSSWFLAPPCNAACPAGIDIRGYIEFITQGKYEEALELIEQEIPLPATVSRVCPHPCEEKCNRSHIDQAIAINNLKRFIVDHTLSRKEKKNIRPFPRIKDEKVAIIGAGPAGFTAAMNLRKLGYEATIFEALPVAGGMLAVGIPEYRLPKQLLQEEISDIQKMGVGVKINCPVGLNGLTLEELARQGYKAIFIATGAHRSIKLDLPGENLEGVYYGTDFLKDVNLARKVNIGKKVAVIGGGNVALDSARTAIRLGAGEVFILYRRSKKDMPCYEREAEAAEKEGVKIICCALPVRILGQNGRVQGIECLQTELTVPDSSGRRIPMPIQGTEFVLDAETIIPAIGETPDLSFLEGREIELTPRGTINVNPKTLSTKISGLFAGGDVVNGPSTIIESISAGKRAAISIDRYLSGQGLEHEEIMPRIIEIEDIDKNFFKKKRRQKMPLSSIKERIHTFKEVELGLTEEAAFCEADRCLQCGMYPKK